jgi:TonB family protein
MALRRLAPIVALSCGLSLAAAQQAAPEPLQVSSDVMGGLLVKRVAPAYPPLARQARIQGTVTLRVVITKSGDATDVRLVSGHPMLAPAAIEAVKQWKYKPYTLNGEPVDVETNVQVIFKIAGEGEASSPDVPTGIAGDIPGGAPPGTIGSVRSEVPRTEPGSAPPQRVRVSVGISSGMLQTKVNPKYPPDAREQGIQGIVRLKINIDTSGNVYSVQLISGHPSLAAAAMDAVRQWKYKPYLLNGTPIEVETTVQVVFTLSGR